jgi:aldose 1-epimerase
LNPVTPSLIEIITLASRRSNWRMQIAPSRGAVALAIEAHHAGRWHPVALPTDPDVVHNDSRLRYSNYALLPYSNRIGHGKIFAVSDKPLPPNWPGISHPIHGLGWLLAWRVAQQDSRDIKLTLNWRGGDAWSWPMRGDQRLRLLGRNVLQMDLRLTNTGTQPMPAGIGWHPYFMADAGATLRTRARLMQVAGSDGIPTGFVDPTCALARGEKTDVRYLSPLDNGFVGWSGEAELSWPQRCGLRMHLQARGALRRHCVIYAPAEKRFFCLEPVSHGNNALALDSKRAAQIGQRWLAPGEALSGSMRWVLKAPKSKGSKM